MEILDGETHLNSRWALQESCEVMAVEANNTSAICPTVAHFQPGNQRGIEPSPLNEMAL